MEGEVGRGDGFDIGDRSRFDDFSENEFGKVSKNHHRLQRQIQRPVSALNHRENYRNFNSTHYSSTHNTSSGSTNGLLVPQVTSARQLRPRSAIQSINGPQRSDHNLHSARDQIFHTSRFASGGNGDGDHQVQNSKEFGHRVKEMKQIFESPRAVDDDQFLSPRIFRESTPKPAEKESARARRRAEKEQDQVSEKKSGFRDQVANSHNQLNSDDEDASVYCPSSCSEKYFSASDSDKKSIDNKSKIIHPRNNRSKPLVQIRVRSKYSSPNNDQDDVDYDADQDETQMSATSSQNGERGSGSEYSEIVELVDEEDSRHRRNRSRNNSIGNETNSSSDENYQPEDIMKLFATSEDYLADSNDIVDLNEETTFYKTKENSDEPDYDLNSIMNDTGGFAMQPVPFGMTVKCRITRDRKGLNKNLFPVYYLHLETNDGKKVPVLGARKRKKTATSSYIISKDPTNLSRKSSEFLGKLRSSVKGLHFDVYDKGTSPKAKVSLSDVKRGYKVLRQELLSINYDLNILGLKGPRKMKFTIPRMVSQFKRVEIRPASTDETILQKAKNGELDDLVELVNKKPNWHSGSQSYVLNFKGRVTIASVKNFQVIHPENDKYIVLQFGRVGDNIFSLDINYPLCPMQAFGIVLSSFDDKYACQ